MKLGEFRTRTRDLENKLDIKLSIYDEFGGYGESVDLEIDIATDNNLYFRIVRDD